jgi:hypothetical protein
VLPFADLISAQALVGLRAPGPFSAAVAVAAVVVPEGGAVANERIFLGECRHQRRRMSQELFG